MFMYTIQDPYVLIDNLDPDKIYMCRIAAITTGKGPFSEMITIAINDYCDSDSEQSSESVDTCTFTGVELATSITSGILLLLLFLSIIVVIVCACSKVCGNSKENTATRCAVECPVYEMIDTTEINLSKSKTPTVKEHSLPPIPPPLPHPSDLIHTDNFKSDTSHGHEVGHPTESTYQPLLPIRAHQKSISTEYQSLRQLSKEKSCDLPPPLPPNPKC